MIIVASGANNIIFNASGEVYYSNYILEIQGVSMNYTQDVTLLAPEVTNNRYLKFVVTQQASPDTSNAEMYLPSPGTYAYAVYNTDSDKDSGNVIFRGLMRLDQTPETQKAYVSTKERKFWS